MQKSNHPKKSVTKKMIALTSEDFKILASDKRLAILNALQTRQMNITELSKHLNLNKSSIYEHTQKLLKADLIKRHQRQNHKIIYYTLSGKTNAILDHGITIQSNPKTKQNKKEEK